MGHLSGWLGAARAHQLQTLDLLGGRLVETVTLGVQIEFEMSAQLELGVDLGKMIAQRVLAHLQ